jgi:transcriptional regulator with XRE-family HTH domain
VRTHARTRRRRSTLNTRCQPRKAREAAGLSQEALGHAAAFHPTEVNRIERGRRNPGLLTIIKLAKALGISAGDLLAGL